MDSVKRRKIGDKNQAPKIHQLLKRLVIFGFLVTLLPDADSLHRREQVQFLLDNSIVGAYIKKINLMTRAKFLDMFGLRFI